MWIVNLRNNHKLLLYFSSLIFLITSLTVLLQIISALFIDKDGLSRLIYFTIQSNVLVSLIVLFYILKKQHHLWFNRLAFIGLINISVTGVVFHVLLTPYMSSVSFMQHMLHTINPLLYIIFYFFFITTFIPLKELYISLIYPLLYILFVFLFVSPVLGDYLESMTGSWQVSRYVYPFLNPNNYRNGIVGMLIFNLGILAPSIFGFSFLLRHLKQTYELSIQKKETSGP